MTYRAVCPFCSAYIRSASVEAEEMWKERAEHWLATHICGWHAGDGIEKPSRFAEYELSPFIKSIARHYRKHPRPHFI